MTRAEILEQYNVNERGTIITPGKFEAEAIYAPAFYEALLSGFADDELSDGTAIFTITAEDRTEFPELPADAENVAVWEDDQGFFFCKPISAAELEAVIIEDQGRLEFEADGEC